VSELFGALGLIVTAINYYIYIPSVLRGQTKPHIFSWVIWTALTTVIFLVQVTSGSGPGSWTTGATALACFAITLLCFKYGTPDITTSDKVSFVLGIAAGIAWFLTTTPLLTLLFILLAETLAFYPTFRKSYDRPREEPLACYYLSSLKLALSVGATDNYNFYTLAYPIYFIILYAVYIIMVFYRTKEQRISP
jgi:hypothetical protein